MAIKVRNKLYASGDKVRYKYYRNKIYTLKAKAKGDIMILVAEVIN